MFWSCQLLQFIHFPRRELHHEQSTQAAQSDQVWGVQQGLNTEQNHECTVHITHSPGWPLKPHQADSSVRCKDVQTLAEVPVQTDYISLAPWSA